MKNIVKKTFIVLLVGMLSSSLFAQEKTQAYYNTHESEILPDARAAFQRGDYERTVELCRWHYIIVGNQDADSLRSMAERCARLSEEMINQKTAGKMKEAEEAANTLLSINPNDFAAKQLIEELAQQATPLPLDTVIVTNPPMEDPAVWENITNQEQVSENEQRIEEPVDPVREIPVKPVPPTTAEKPRTRFVLKAGASIIDLKQIAQSVAPGGSLGLYDLGGSRVGLEAGGYYCSNFNSTVSLLGIDASLVLRVAKGVYPKVGVGYFSYNPISAIGSTTQGLCGGAGLSFILGSHFCLEVGARYYPAFKIMNSEQAITSGISYQFPVVKQFYSGGIAPMVSIGWAF